ncbi:substrate-binding domain-containing protein [Kitasatospora sp. NPDC058965]|uniref:substrate-binding domain-containing protein n=1 Tax=Kitasatospora sp. NPDC058965 TaxID=3346682 RepID=UPI0036839E4F
MVVPAQARHARILELVRQAGTLRVAELARRLGAPAVTVRRDVAALADRGALVRSHGTVSAAPHRGGRRWVIGMLVPTTGSYFAEVIAGARAAAAAVDARLVLGIAPYAARDDRAQVERLLEAGVDGLLVAPNWLPGGAVAGFGWLDALPVPTVLVERRAAPDGPGAALDSVGSDHAHGVLLALRRLAGLGHRSVLLAARDDSWTAHQVRAGYAAAVAAVGLAPCPVLDVEHVHPGARAQRLADGIAAAARARTRAVVVHNDNDAIAVLPLLRTRGLAVPEQVALISYDDVYAGLAAPPLTAVAPPKRAVGAAAAELLLRRLEAGGVAAGRRVLLLPVLRVRGSCGAPVEHG